MVPWIQVFLDTPAAALDEGQGRRAARAALERALARAAGTH